MKQYLWSVVTGNFDPFVKGAKKAVEYIQTLDGFVAVHPSTEGRGIIWLFDSENNAKGAINLMRSKGIHCGTNICRFEWDKANNAIIFADENYESKEARKV